jgi:hypothetical protein
VAAFLVGAATVLAWWVTRAHKNELQIARQDAM